MQSLSKRKKCNNFFSVVIHIGNYCNLRCEYCYNKQDKSESISIKIVDQFLNQILEFVPRNKPLIINWSGGEPLMLGIDFFKQVFKIQNSMDSFFINKFQSNGTLIDSDWISLFKNSKVNCIIGISLDGPGEFNNFNRIYKNGKGTYYNIVNAIDELRKFELFSGIITVLTPKLINNCDANIYYEFIKKNNYGVRINLLHNYNLIRNKSSLENYISGAKNFLQYLFKIWYSDKNSPDIDPFNIIIDNFSNKNCNESIFGGCLTNTICLAPNGNIFPCSLTISLNEYNLGNIMEISFSDILVAREKILDRYNLRSNNCINCKFWNVCQGGCVYSSLLRYNSIEGPDLYCEIYKSLFDYIKTFNCLQ